ncbi:MAG: ABC transporter permease subunit [Bacteroidota bacterium]
MSVLLFINEVKRHLLSLRFVMALVFILTVYIGSSLVFCKKYLNEKEKDIGNLKNRQAEYQNATGGAQGLYNNVYTLVKFQELSSFFGTGNEGRIPKAMIIMPSAAQAQEASGGMIVGQGGRNFKLENYADFDLTFIVGVVLSFLALVFSFDAISGDREEGTLKLQVSNPVQRVQIFLAKYAAIVFLLLVMVFIGSLLSIIIFQIFIGQNVLFLFPVESIFSILLSMVYLSMFVLLGLWISASVSKSTTSLAIILLIWIVLVVLSPYIGALIAHRYYPVKSQQEQEEKFQALIQSGSQHMPKELTNYYHGTGTESEWPAVEQYYIKQDESFEKLTVDRFQELMNQAIKAEALNFFSPYGAFRQAMQRIANTGLPYEEKFYWVGRQYRSDLAHFILSRDNIDRTSKHHPAPDPRICSLSSQPIDPPTVPRFQPPVRKIHIDDIQDALPAVGYLLILNLVFFMLTQFTVENMDVR